MTTIQHNETITVVNEDGELFTFDPATQSVVGKMESKSSRCHCEREPSKIWTCCLLANSTCECRKK